MKIFSGKRTRNHVNKRQRYPMYAALTLIACLVIALTVVAVINHRTAERLSYGQQQLASQIQSNITQTIRTFEKMDLPGANVPGELLPAMELYLYAAEELNDVMIEVYGLKQSMFDEETFHQIELAINGVSGNIDRGEPYEASKGILKELIARVETDLNERFAGTGLLMSYSGMK